MRKPIDKQQPTECRQAIWDGIKSHPEAAFTITEIAKYTRLEVSTVRDYIIGLLKAGYLGGTKEYFLIKDTGVDAPRVRKDGTPVTQGRGRQQMWNAMRVLKTFTALELAFNASTEEHQTAESEAKSYCLALFKAGYLVRRKASQYQLLAPMWTGPQPPQIQRTKQIYDPNLKRVVWTQVKGGADEQ